VLLFTNWLPDNVVFLRLRGFLAAPFLGSCGKNLRIGRDITFYNPQNIYIGSNVYIAKGNWFNGSAKITIEDEVIFGPYSVISASNHTMLDDSFRYGPPLRKSIAIGAGSWIAGNCSITAGVSIGKGVLITGSSAVTKDIPNFHMAGGVPAKVIKPLK
jgi:maltose O-acetyltransferase